jgi:ABC-type branched-subunit amino acid transport system substrate-binding protein
VAVLVSLGLAAGALAVTASPGSAGGNGDGAAQQFPPVDQPGVSPTEIRVGGVAAETNNLVGDTFGSTFDGVKAYFNMVNASKDKGIYGRKLVLAEERDDGFSNNRQEIQALLDSNVFAALPMATVLFSGSELLVQQNVPTFGWNINAQWGSEQGAGPPNFFGEKGSYLCFTCPSQGLPWLAQRLKAKRVALLAYSVEQSADCAEGVQASFQKYPSANLEVVDTSLSFGVSDVSGPVSQIVDKDVDLVTTCMDQNGVLTVARELRKQGSDAIMYLPQGYTHKFIEENGRFFQGSYTITFFTPLEVKDKPKGLRDFEKWMKRGGFEQNEHSIAGWINADLFYQGLKAAGPQFTRQSVIDAINAMTDYKAGGLLPGIDWRTAHSQEPAEGCLVYSKIQNGKFVPSFAPAGKPFVCLQENPQPDKLQTKPTFK